MAPKTRTHLLALPLLLTVIGGCTDAPLAPVGFGPSGDNITYIEQRYNQPQIDGVVKLESDFREDSRAQQFADGTFGEYVGTDNYAFIYLRDRSDRPRAIDRATVNGRPLELAGSGGGIITSLSLHSWNTAVSYHDTTNVVTLAAPTLAAASIPDVRFDAAIRMENIVRNQKIGRKENLVLKWTPSDTDDFVEIDFMQQVIGAPETADGESVGFTLRTLEDNGSIIIPWQRFNDLAHNGFYSLELRRYEPHFHTLPDGNRICVLGVSQHSVSVEVVD